MKKTLLLLTLLCSNLNLWAQKKDYVVTLSSGPHKAYLILYDETPLHKKNFIKLAKKGFYNELLFHRVIENFMIQGGDPNSKKAKDGEALGSGGDNMPRIPFEFNPNRIHKKGALAAARDNNPEKKSSACQFYLVQGKVFNDNDLDGFEKRNKMHYTPEQRNLYKTLGGTPHLDNNYTVFGEVMGSTALIDSIAKVKGDERNRPLENQRMKMKVKKMRKSKITQKYGYTF